MNNVTLTGTINDILCETKHCDDYQNSCHCTLSIFNIIKHLENINGHFCFCSLFKKLKLLVMSDLKTDTHYNGQTS